METRLFSQEDTGNAASWDDRDTLVFREVRQSGPVPLTQECQHVDITSHWEYGSHQEGTVLTLSWSGCLSPKGPMLTITFSRSNSAEDTTTLVNKLFEKKFYLLREFAIWLFKEYKSKILEVTRNPLTFQLLHDTTDDLEVLLNNMSDIERYINSSTNCGVYFTISIKRQDDEDATPPGRLEKLNTGADIVVLQRLEKRLLSQVEVIDAQYRDQRNASDTMLSSVRTLLRHERGKVAIQRTRKHQDSATPRTQGDVHESLNLVTRNSRKVQTIQHTNLNDTRDSKEKSTSSLGSGGQVPGDTSSKDPSKSAVIVASGNQSNESPNEISPNNPQPIQEAKSWFTSTPSQGDNMNDVEIAGSTITQPHAKVNSTPSSTIPLRSEGMDTFLCFHTSGGSRGGKDDECLREMKQLALTFIEGIEDIAVKHGLEENIGLVFCNDTTMVTHQPTNDYSKVRINVGKLSHGNVPLGEMLRLTLNFVRDKGTVCIVDDDGTETIQVRLVVLSNYGHSGGGLNDARKTIEADGLNPVLQQLYSEAKLTRTVWIPTGSADRAMIQLISRLSNGHAIDGQYVCALYGFHSTGVATGKIRSFKRKYQASLKGVLDEDLQFLMEMFGSHLDPANKAIVEWDLKVYYMGLDEKNYHKERKDLPPLGGRVVRGKDWRGGHIDCGQAGTVTGHLDGGMIAVMWDHGVLVYYRYGAEGSYDVKVVTDRPRDDHFNYSLCLGCEVERGPDWGISYDDEDGGPGALGVVFAMSNDIATVRWHRTGRIGTYCVGKDAKVEVIMRQPYDNGAVTQEPDENKPSSPDYSRHSTPACHEDVKWAWQWEEECNLWHYYSETNCQKLEGSYNRRPDGSCLVQRDGTSYRVLFKSMEEKNIRNNFKQRVRRQQMSTLED